MCKEICRMHDCVLELRQQETFYNELWLKYKRDNYLAITTAYRIAARIVERAIEEAMQNA